MKLCKSILDMSPLNIINLPLSFIPISLFLLKVIWLSILEIDEAKHPNKIFIFRKLHTQFQIARLATGTDIASFNIELCHI